MVSLHLHLGSASLIQLPCQSLHFVVMLSGQGSLLLGEVHQQLFVLLLQVEVLVFQDFRLLLKQQTFLLLRLAQICKLVNGFSQLCSVNFELKRSGLVQSIGLHAWDNVAFTLGPFRQFFEDLVMESKQIWVLLQRLQKR